MIGDPLPVPGQIWNWNIEVPPYQFHVIRQLPGGNWEIKYIGRNYDIDAAPTMSSHFNEDHTMEYIETIINPIVVVKSRLQLILENL